LNLVYKFSQENIIAIKKFIERQLIRNAVIVVYDLLKKSRQIN